jgi:CHAD domain-containing protein
MADVVTCRGGDTSGPDLERDMLAAGYVIAPAVWSAATVLDTFDGRLHAAGLRLDHTASAIVLHDDDGRAARAIASMPPRFPGDLERGPLRSRLADVVEVRALLPLATVATTSRRAERRNGDGKVTSAVTIHTDLTADGAALAGRLVTVEQLTGYAKQGERAREIVTPHVTEALGTDAVDAILTLAGVDRAGRHVEPGIALEADMPAVEGFRHVLANLDDALEANRPGTIDDLDSEFLHDLRVAVRRSRSILRHGRKVLGPDVLAWAEPGLKLVGDVTGPARDLDVQALDWDVAVAVLDEEDRRALDPLHRQLLADRDAAHVALATHLASGDTSELLRRWHDAVHAPMAVADAGPKGGDPLLDVVRTRVRRAQSRLLEHGRAITPETPADDVHDVRKDAKKLRYLLECFADLFPAGGRKAFVRRLKKLQDLLGEHQDSEVQAVELRAAAARLPPDTDALTYIAVGRLVEHLERTRQAARDGFAARFEEYDSAATRQVLDDMLDGADR